MICFTVPGTPVSVNHMYHSRGRIRFLCKEGKEYKVKVAEIASKAGKVKINEMEADVEMTITYFFGDMRRRDVTNYDKGILDSLTGVLYKDDSQIQKITLQKFIDKKNPRVQVSVEYK